MDYLNELNDAQRKAVEATEGPVMVIAGAGSGKTRVLTYRIAHLMNKGVDPFNILSLTFTNKAAREMKDRIASVVGASETKNLWMGTFHSVFARILRVEAPRIGYPSNFTIYDQQDALSVMKKVIQEMQLDKDIYKPKQVLYRISQFKNNLITVKSYFNNPELMEADAASLKPKMGDVYRLYVEKCFKSGAMDFDDLLLRTNEILTRFPEVLAKYQDRFRYILVDEYQDTNHSQYLIVKALASRYENVCVVGDDAQSIYAFRGANIGNILNFQRDYPDAQMYPLEQNYRSTQTIVEAANSVIEHNRDRIEKEVWTQNAKGAEIPVYRALTDADEARHVASTIFEEHANDSVSTYDDFAILYRTNAQSRAIEEAFRKRNIPYRIFGGLSFYQRKEIKDLIAYLRLLINENDEEALMRIINYPARGIGGTTINKLLVYAAEKEISVMEILKSIRFHGQAVGLNMGTMAKLENFYTMIQRFQLEMKNKDVHEVAMQVAQVSGLLKVLREDDTPEGIARMDNIQELLNSLQGFVEEQQQVEDGDPSLAAFLEDVALATDADREDDTGDRVSLMTVHLAKGLEFKNVFVIGLEDGLFPSQMSMNTRAELEEERRLFYVALTRAELKAFFTYAVTRFRWGKIVDSEPSRFLEEVDDQYLKWENLQASGGAFNASGLNMDMFGDLPQKDHKSFKPQTKQAPKPATQAPSNLKPLAQAQAQTRGDTSVTLKKGDRVSHDRFGMGTVELIEGDPQDAKAVIMFDNEGEKRLLLKFAKLEVVNG